MIIASLLLPPSAPRAPRAPRAPTVRVTAIRGMGRPVTHVRVPVDLTVADVVELLRCEVQRCVEANTQPPEKNFSATSGLFPRFGGYDFGFQGGSRALCSDNQACFAEFCQVQAGGSIEVVFVPNDTQLVLFGLLEGV